MSSTKRITVLVVLTFFTVLFQIIPVVFSHKYVLLTLFSALPIYLITRTSGPMGLVAFVAAGILIFGISSHEGLFFLFANGPVGLVLGLGEHFSKRDLTAAFLTAITLTITLSLLNFVIGIKVFGTSIPGSLGVQILIIFLFSFIYSVIYSYMAGFVYRLLRKRR
jgi:hypothetical protein